MVDFQELGELEQRIVMALQVDGRATWRKIAKVLDEPERTVARHGAALLEDGKVNIAAIRHRAGAVIAALNCVPARFRWPARHCRPELTRASPIW